MDVALHRNKFGLVILFGNWRRSRWLRLVPFAVDLWQRVNVVRGLVRVGDFQRLVNLECQYVRYILAALLLELHYLAGSVFVRNARRDVNHYIVERIVRTSNHSLGRDRSGVLLGATRLLGHIDGLLFGGRALIGHFTADGSAAWHGMDDDSANGQRRHSCYVPHFYSHALGLLFKNKLAWN